MDKKHDAYGQEVWECYHDPSTHEIVERDDGYIDVGNAEVYFRPFKKWPAHERKAIRFAQGEILDIGCGAGRVENYLQQRGRKVLGIDNSPLAIKVSKLRGAQNVKVLDIKDIDGFSDEAFDTIVMFGNNFGLFGSEHKAKRLLKQMHRITSRRGRVIAATTDPYKTTNPVHKNYHLRNRKRGRMAGQLRLRVRHGTHIGKWFDYLFVSEKELQALVAGTGWHIARTYRSKEANYAIVLEKD